MRERPSRSGSEALESAYRAAQALAPEVDLFAGLDPVALARSFSKAVLRGATKPVRLARVSSRYATGMTRATLTCGARALGADISPPMKPAAGDRRFADPAWEGNPWFTWRLQRYLMGVRLLNDLVDNAGLEDPEASKARLGAEMLIDALAPTNALWSNPAALKKAFDTGGRSVARGLANFIDDLVHNDGRPRQVDTSSFTLGANLAATPGKVVFRNELMELIQYSPQTEKVHEVPLLASPPWINKYYIMDLAPGRSFLEWAVQQGHTVFTISYRNPVASMADTSMDDYLLHGPRVAIDVIREITGADKVNVAALCLGGTLATAMVAYLEARGEERVNSLTLLNTLVDFSDPGPLGVFTDAATLDQLERKMAERGYLEGSEMRGTFDVLRANDLIWNYVASNWLMGEDPPAFDILAWNADSTRMPARMHAFYLRRCYLENELARGELELAGQQLSLEDINQDTFIVAAINDHIAPWKASYKTTQLLPKADVEFVLSSSGHIAGIVNPPSPKARHWTNPDTPSDPDAWLAGATEHQRSWWETWAQWTGERAGDLVDPPPMGSAEHPPLEDAPGTYVRES